MLKIEIFEEDERILTRNIPAKDDRPAREIREQIAYAHLGGKFPVEMKLQIEEGQPHYAAGLYTVHNSSFIVNRFGGLELKRFGMLIEPIVA